jgi:hypothetical protein
MSSDFTSDELRELGLPTYAEINNALSEARTRIAQLESPPSQPETPEEARNRKAGEALWSDPEFLRSYAQTLENLENGVAPTNLIHTREELQALFDSASQPETVLEWVRVRERETSGVNDYEDWEPKDAVIGFTIRKYFNPTLVEIHFSGGKKTRSFDAAKSLAQRLQLVLDSARGDG